MKIDSANTAIVRLGDVFVRRAAERISSLFRNLERRSFAQHGVTLGGSGHPTVNIFLVWLLFEAKFS
jgi:hypothetical protein